MLAQCKKDSDDEILTPGKTGSQDTGNLLDQGVGSNESIVLAGKLLDELLVLVELLQVLFKLSDMFRCSVCRVTHISAHGIDTMVLGTVNVVLVTENANAHA